MPTGRQVELARRPEGRASESCFRLVEAPLPDPAPGQVLVRNLAMSVDPYMRLRMDPGPSYVPPFEVGRPLDGAAVGEVVASRDPALPEGSLVRHRLGWRDLAVLDAAAAQPVDARDAEPTAYLGVLGTPGLTAWVGLLDVAQLRPGDAVFVSAAAGAVGHVAGQLARLRGHRVIGSAGSPEKVRRLVDELGFDAAFDYHDGPVEERLREHAPDGIDVYFDNVGGEHLEAAIALLRRGGRVAACGAIAGYDDSQAPPGPRNLRRLFTQRLTLRGFIVSDHLDRFEPFLAEAGPLVRDGRLRAWETVVDGLDRAPEALLSLFEGRNVGKLVVRL